MSSRSTSVVSANFRASRLTSVIIGSLNMDYDRILTQLGEFGPWQRRLAIMLWIPAVGAGINVMIAAFAVMGPRNGYRCRNECDVDGFKYDDWLNKGYTLSQMFPSFNNKSDDYDPEDPDYCVYYKATKGSDGTCSFSNEELSCKSGMDYAYDDFDMDKTVATENNLVCGDYFWTIIVDEMFMLGLMIGSFVFGVMSDKIGRRHTLMLAIVCCAVGNLLCCAMPNHWSYSIPRILASAGGEGTFVLAFTMSLEYSGIKESVPVISWVTWSTLLANVIGIPFAIGEAIPSLIAMGLHDWLEFQAAVSSVIAITAIVWFFLPESPRWLIANGRKEEAKAMIEKAAKVNKVKLTPDIFEADINKPEEEVVADLPVYGLKDMFRRSQITITLALFVCWPVVTLLYYGLSLSADKIHMTDNVYLSYILVCLIEIPAYIILPITIDVWGRKPLFFMTQFVPGICCIVAAFLTPGTAIFAILALGAKLGAAAAFNVTFMYTAQLYPTSIRNSAVGTCSTIARLGGMLSPVIGKFLVETGKVPEELPMTLFGAFGIVGGLCALLLPDTVGFPLPNTFEDVEEIKKKSKPIWKCYKAPADD